jgi:hypothetical protein
MITAILIDFFATSKVCKYETSSEEEVISLIIKDWKNGLIIWDNEQTNNDFSSKWLVENGLEPLESYYTKE